MRAYHSGSNQFGFNDIDYPLEKPDGTYRVLFQGDSFSWASGCERNYLNVVRQLLKQPFPDRAIDVINAGYGQTHTGEQLALLEKFALQYDPDLVILGFFAGNDFIDGDPHRKRIILCETRFDIGPRTELIIGGIPIVPESCLIAFVAQRIAVLTEDVGDNVYLPDPVEPPQIASEDKAHADRRLRRLSELCAHDSGEPSLSRESYLELEAARMRVSSRDPDHETAMAPNFEFILGKLDEMIELLAHAIRRAYLVQDSQWNDYGNCVVGHAFYRDLRERLPLIWKERASP